VNALLTGEVDAAFVTHIVVVCRRPETSRSSGQHRCNACGRARRATFTEQGINGFVAAIGTAWAPRGIPTREARLADEIAKIALRPIPGHAKSLGVDANIGMRGLC